MNWEALGILVEIFGVLIVGATLVYLSIQTRQNTVAIQASIRQSMLEADCGFLYRQQDYPLTSPLLVDSKELSEEELSQAFLSIIAFVRSRESHWLQYQNGVLDAETWETYRTPLIDQLTTKVGKACWEFFICRGHINNKFVDEVNKYLKESEPLPQKSIRELLNLDN